MKKQILSVFGHAQSGSNQRDFYFTPTIKKSIAILLVFLFSITAILKAQEPVTIYRYATPGTPLGRVLVPGNFIFVRSTAKLYELTGNNPIGKTETPQSIVASGKVKDYSGSGGVSATMLHDTVYAYKRPYKVYTALLTQEGTNTPVAIVLENTIGIITLYYNDTGYYYVTIPYTTGNVFVLIGLNTSVTTRITSEYQADGETIAIYSRNNGTLSNGLMYNIPIEIRVYP
jgi:hypothetical protein